ncbi:hypothetical protein C8Q76DRAFT_694225 [Earliella scabrosa]|nr:hypothetical protein C8Q76DRAFT_694225 [Earliella scabrosa]
MYARLSHNSESTDEQPTVLRCGHVICYGCFKQLIATPQPYCPFRCDITRRLVLDDGKTLQFSMKEPNYEADKKAAVVKTSTELHHASVRLYSKRKQMKNRIASLTTLIRNQKNTITGRIRHITRDATRAEGLRSRLIRAQTADVQDTTASTSRSTESRISRMSPRKPVKRQLPVSGEPRPDHVSPSPKDAKIL